MKLLIDIGNTRLKWAHFGSGAMVADGALAHADPDFARHWRALLDSWPAPGSALLASVGPAAVTATVVDALATAGIAIERPRVLAERPELRIAYREPARFGVDRWLALLGARRRWQEPLLLAACGTALTVDLVDAAGHHRGGVIAPSPALMAEALRARAPHLPDAAATAPPAFADDTADAIAAGCQGAALGLVGRMLDAARAQGIEPLLVLTGGGAGPLAAQLEVPLRLAPTLVLEGLAVLAAGSDGGAAGGSGRRSPAPVA